MKYRILYSALIVAFSCNVAVADEANEARMDREIQKEKISKKMNAQNIAVNKAAIAAIQLKTGPAGAKGATGAQGIQGLTGAKGATGAAGAKGATGAQGIQGLAGATGAAGAKGDTGAQGLIGLTGAVGPQGPIGLIGPKGATGPQGPQGIQGKTGPQGSKGVTGAKGAQGPAGPAGLQGPIGLTGASGMDGASGAQGPAGLQGSQGPAGASCTVVGNGNGTSTLSCPDGTSAVFNTVAGAVMSVRQANGCLAGDTLYAGLCITPSQIITTQPTSILTAGFDQQCKTVTGIQSASLVDTYMTLQRQGFNQPNPYPGEVLFPSVHHAYGQTTTWMVSPAPMGGGYIPSTSTGVTIPWIWSNPATPKPWYFNCSYPAQ